MMKRDLERRLGRLEQEAAPDPAPPELWFCEDGMCRNGKTGVTITVAELMARPQTGRYAPIIIARDDDETL
jgi:hypothetical protein